MIIKNLYKVRVDGVELYRYRSDCGKQLQQDTTGYLYDEAIDPENSSHTYMEVDSGNEIPAEEALKIITGGGGNDDQG